jgi:hypothetical protein
LIGSKENRPIYRSTNLPIKKKESKNLLNKNELGYFKKYNIRRIVVSVGKLQVYPSNVFK